MKTALVSPAEPIRGQGLDDELELSVVISKEGRNMCETE
jgi:2-keto-4-pentenoate hydratase/2-oxohepta-3-ene-1,7-dioic acid hydratase in catechol pathway